MQEEYKVEVTRRMDSTTLIALAALFIAVVAFAHARRSARKLAILEEQYWQLKFEHGELKAKIDAPPSPPTFVPLVRRRPTHGETGSQP
jgi:hypothetical protein